MKVNRSVKRSIEILTIISQSKDGLTLADVQKFLEIPKSSAFDLVQTLLATNMIMPSNNDEKKYVIGINSFLIGSAYESDLVKIARKHLKVLAEDIGKTIFLGVEKNGEIIYIDKAEPKSAIFTIATLGSTNPIHCTSLGKAIAAEYPRDRVEAILDEKGMPSYTKYTITDKDSYFEELDRVRIKGYSLDDRELEEQMLCIGSPIFDSRNKVIAAISASGFFNGHDIVPEHGKKVRETALEISRALGCRC